MGKVGLRVLRRFLITFDPAAAMNVDEQRAGAFTLGLPEVEHVAFVLTVADVGVCGCVPCGSTRLLGGCRASQAEDQGGNDNMCFHRP